MDVFLAVYVVLAVTTALLLACWAACWLFVCHAFAWEVMKIGGRVRRPVSPCGHLLLGGAVLLVGVLRFIPTIQGYWHYCGLHDHPDEPPWWLIPLIAYGCLPLTVNVVLVGILLVLTGAIRCRL